jgi:hypothetical protein
MSYTTLGGVAVVTQYLFDLTTIQNDTVIEPSGSLASHYTGYGAGPKSFFLTQNPWVID